MFEGNQWNLKRGTTYTLQIKRCHAPFIFLGVCHTHTDHSRKPISGIGARSGVKDVPLQKKQVFETVFKGEVIGQNVTVSTTDFGPIHGVVIPNLGEINIRFLMGKVHF